MLHVVGCCRSVGWLFVVGCHVAVACLLSCVVRWLLVTCCFVAFVAGSCVLSVLCFCSVSVVVACCLVLVVV